MEAIGNLADLFTLSQAAVWAGKWIKVWWEGRKAEKPDVAIVVDLSKPILKDVEHYLNEARISANVVKITPTVKDLGVRPEEWKGAASEFAQILRSIQEQMGSKTLHIFIAAPSVLAFAMGCIAGMDFDVHLYHWFPSMKAYAEVLRVSRELLK